METKTDQKKAGRPRKHKDSAARVKAFRAKAAYPGHRCDIYLGEDAYVVLCMLKKKSGLSSSEVVDSVLRGTLQMTNR